MAIKLLILIVAYNHEKTIRDVLGRIPIELNQYETEILIIDDGSVDNTYGQAEAFRKKQKFPFSLTILKNPVNQGYGGNQKIGFEYAIKHKFDVVALLHGDGQYSPEKLPELVLPIVNEDADAVFGSRMMVGGDALKGGMPLYKFVGNRILSSFQNWVLGTKLTEFHSGFRVYSVEALKKIPFNLNTNVFHFDTEIIIQLILSNLRIKELPIPTYYGDEICNVDGLVYAKDVFKATAILPFSRMGVFYQRKYDLTPNDNRYVSKLGIDSSHQRAVNRVPRNRKVLDIGCGTGAIARFLRLNECDVVGIDGLNPDLVNGPNKYYKVSLDDAPLPVDAGMFDVILLLDIIEHLKKPEAFIDALSSELGNNPQAEIIATTGNVAFGPLRIMLMLGMFNYGKRGILDQDHTRLFTFNSFRKLFEQRGFDVLELSGIPAPFPLAINTNWIAKSLTMLNNLGIAVWRKFFSYQIFIRLKPRPSLEWLLIQAERQAKIEVGKVS